MKDYKLYANCYPLEPNKLFCVDTTQYLGTEKPAEKLTWIQKRRKALQDLGFKTEIHEVITNIFK